MIKGSQVTASELGLADEIWVKIAGYFPAIDLNRFVRSAKLFKEVGTDHTVAKPIVMNLYNRLREIDISLPVKFITEDPINEYLAALALLRKRQDKELAYLREHHPQIVAQRMNNPALATMTPLNRLEATSQIIDQINIDIITPSIDHQSNELNIEGIHITRIPPRLFSMPQYLNYFNALEELNCGENYIKILVLDNLPSLRVLECYRNKLHTLLLGNLPSIEDIDCNDNHLRGVLDLSRFQTMWNFTCHNNNLSNVIVLGLHQLQRLDCSNNFLTNLEIDSPVLEMLRCNSNRLNSLIIKHINMPDDGDFDIRSNNLSKIPQNLIDHYGLEWAEEAQNDQDNRESELLPSEQASDYRVSIASEPNDEHEAGVASEHESDDELAENADERVKKRFKK